MLRFLFGLVGLWLFVGPTWAAGDDGSIFLPPRIVLQQASDPGRLALADVDGDGRPDLLAYLDPQLITVRMNVTGRFGEPVVFHQLELQYPYTPTLLRVVDLDSDGQWDLLFGNGHDLYSCRIDASGEKTISMPWNLGLRDARNMSGSYALLGAFDLDGNGILELVISKQTFSDRYPYSWSLTHVLNSCRTSSPSKLIDGMQYNDPVPVAATSLDYNEDGALDLIVRKGSRAWLFLNDSSHYSGFVKSSLADAPASPVAIDVDFDGDTDLLLGNSWLECDRSTSPTAWTSHPVSLDNLGIYADLNMDGCRDIFRSGDGTLLINGGGGPFGPFDPPQSFQTFGTVRHQWLTDFDADGDQDVLVHYATSSEHILAFYQNQTLRRLSTRNWQNFR